MDVINIYDGPEIFLQTFGEVRREIGLMFATGFCQDEVCNGGFSQFFWNSTGVLAPEAVEGFIAIGQPDIADLVAQAMARLGLPYQRDRWAREDALKLLPKDAFDDLEKRFYALIHTEGGGFSPASERYARRHGCLGRALLDFRSMTGLERLRRDSRATSELIETALAEAARVDDLPEGDRADAVLHARGTREVLVAALELCGSSDPQRRALGAEILGQLGSPERTFPEECCDALLDLVRHDPDRQVLRMAVFALGHLGNRRCEPDLIVLRSHPDNAIRHGVAFALCGATSPSAVEALLELMDDPYALARDWATTSIGQTVSVDGPEIRAALLRRATDNDVFTRAEALHGLARRHDERVVPYLIAELPVDRDCADLFRDAAKAFLGLDEERKVDREDLIAALRSGRGDSGMQGG
jgi:HEAT repeat protein